MFAALRFIFGLAIGSFFNVAALRYDPDGRLFSRSLGGRSHCPKCGRILSWYELIPVLSFIYLRGRCRTCRERISFQYPLVELAAGLIFLVNAPMPIDLSVSPALAAAWTGLWIAALLSLLLMAVIDIRLKLVPDEFHFIFLALGLGRIILSRTSFFSGGDSFLGGYTYLFGLHQNIWLNHLAAAFIAGAFFLALVILTRGRGMGVGDVKLAAALGFLFGWPDIGLVVLLSFVFGAVFGVALIAFGRGRMKSIVPFGPFLALASLAVLLWGGRILAGYFGLFGL